jgi:uncharacterized protein YtpQ (UPF0354 family)
MDVLNVFPYLVPGLSRPAFEEINLPIGNGLYATLFVDSDTEDGVVHRTVTADDLKALNLTAEQAHATALENLTRFADSDRLSAKMFGRPDREFHFILYSDHPRAAACLRVRSIYEEAREHLETDAICAVVPHRESLVVFPMRDRAYREKLVAKLREIEGDVERPLTFALFELTAGGVRPFEEPGA